jgi:hypothetical protein
MSVIGVAVVLSALVALLVGGRHLGAGSALVCMILGLVIGATPVGPPINAALGSVGSWVWTKVSTL